MDLLLLMMLLSLIYSQIGVLSINTANLARFDGEKGLIMHIEAMR